MSLQRAVFVSVLLHIALTAAAGAVIGGLGAPPEPIIEEAGDEIAFNLVDPAAARLGPEDAPPARTQSGAGAAAHATGRRSAGSGPAPSGASSVSERSTEETEETEDAPETPLPETDVDGERPAPAATAAARPAPAPTVVPGRLQPRELAEHVGLETEGLDEQVLERMFSAMHKYALESPRPAASTYRQLLRAWIDGLMGFPYPVVEDLARNAEYGFIGGIRIEVDADGSFRLADLWIYDGVEDPGQRLASYYTRIIRDATAHRFLPPSDARLPAPHALEYRIVNPRARR